MVSHKFSVNQVHVENEKAELICKRLLLLLMKTPSYLTLSSALEAGLQYFTEWEIQLNDPIK
jgi:hypothetical protein